MGKKNKSTTKKVKGSQKAAAEAEDQPEVVDYAATADAFFQGGGLENDEDLEPNPPDEEDDDNDKSESDASNEDDSSENEAHERTGPNKGVVTSSSQSEEDSEQDDDNEREAESENGGPVGEESEEEGTEDPTSMNDEPCTFDLRNLLAANSHQINTKALYKNKKDQSKQGTETISLSGQFPQVDEEYLESKAFDGCTQLVHALWQLPKEKSDVGTMIKLPPFDDSHVPRALPPPEPRAETKWEKYAKEKGIPLNKTKRSQKVWDEATGTWMFRHGYQKANNDASDWPIMEVKGGDDPYADPWEKQREAKRARVEKNTEQRMRNQERAGNLSKGTTTRMLKGREKTRQAGKAGGNQDRDNASIVRVPPSGVPVDLTPTKTSTDALNPAKRGKNSTMLALKATQLSTASMGRFDKMRQDEPERRKTLAKTKKRKMETGATDRKTINVERERSLKVLKAVVDGGGATKERDIRKGRYAKGETAYDYDFEDGLGPSSFRKKKGRAGAGKAKKMTKKRVK